MTKLFYIIASLVAFAVAAASLIIPIWNFIPIAWRGGPT